MTRVDLRDVPPDKVDDLFRRAAAGEDPTRLAEEAHRLRLQHLIAAAARTAPATVGGRHA